MSILLVPLLNISEKTLNDLKEEIGNTFLSKVIIAQPVASLPENAYDKSREQYDAGKLISLISSQYKDYKADKMIAVGSVDIFVNDMNFVFGVAQKGGRICLISLYRLDQRFYGKESEYDKLRDRAVKEAVHEIGHCCGLDHCKAKNCVMQFSNDIMAVDLKDKFFCEDCREFVRKSL